jgi:hypothetical protein
MPQKHIYVHPTALYAQNSDATDYVKLAATEREQAVTAANEVIGSVHESLACWYAARASERHRKP